jgi:hypothetical protein
MAYSFAIPIAELDLKELQENHQQCARTLNANIVANETSARVRHLQASLSSLANQEEAMGTPKILTP